MEGQTLLTVDAHPLLDVRVFRTILPRVLGEISTPPDLMELLQLNAAAPMKRDDQVREAIRALLRHGGFKPSGRSKPSSEYLDRAAGDGSLGPINPVVDVCNAVSLHSGLPISVVDLAKTKAPFRIGVAPAGSTYVFNASGQVIDLEGLLCLFDAEGPCGNGVKDAQRTKTDADSRETLTVIWGSRALPGRAAEAETWYRQLLERHGARTEIVEIREC